MWNLYHQKRRVETMRTNKTFPPRKKTKLKFRSEMTNKDAKVKGREV